MHAIRNAALTLAIALTASTAQAQTTIITEPAPPRAVVTTQPPTLTPVQRQTIYRTVVREHPPVTVGAPVVEYRVGARVPQTVTLYPVPAEIVTEVPAVRSYRYMVVNNRAWLVDPVTSEVVAELNE